jgi:biopolymer transport protein ExbD
MAGYSMSEVKAEPNLTPLLDVVFQLITFFMMVFKISGENYDQRVRLPVAGSARPVEGRVLEDRLVLNIDGQGRMLWNGQALDIERAMKELRTQGQLVRLNLKIQKKEIKEGENLPTTIIFRADKSVPFTQIYRYITACQANGFVKFALKAMTGER